MHEMSPPTDTGSRNPPEQKPEPVEQKQIGRAVINPRRPFAMTEKAAHEVWARLNQKSPRAGTLMHYLIALMDDSNAVAISQKLLAKYMGVTDRTVQRAAQDLIEANFIQVVRMNGPGSVCAYVINDRVAWQQSRAARGRVSSFTATIVADEDDQKPDALSTKNLYRFPLTGERQIPAGPGEDPPSQAILEGMEPDLPTRNPPSEKSFFDEFMSRGQALPSPPDDPGEEGETK